MKSTPGIDRRRRRIVVAVLLGGVLGCSVFDGLVPRHTWSERWGPMVPHETFPSDCSLCHVSNSWDRLKDDFHFDHAAETGYVLEGAHSQAACLRCHNDRGPVQAYLERGCGGCHTDPHQTTLGMDCTRCHNSHWWEPDGLVAEHAGTRFPLVGSHALAACESCHTRATVGDFRGAPVQCHLCHQSEVLLAQPNHVVNGWVRDCQECHDVDDWRAVNFQHLLFPLDGAHALADCNQCHIGGQVVGTPNDCFSCHRNDYLNTNDHVANGFSTNCDDCHNTDAWDIP